MKKRIISTIVLFALLLSIMPLAAAETGEEPAPNIPELTTAGDPALQPAEAEHPDTTPEAAETPDVEGIAEDPGQLQENGPVIQRVGDTSQISRTFTPEVGRRYYFSATAYYISSFADIEFTLLYDPLVLQLADLCAVTSEKELETGLLSNRSRDAYASI